MGLFGVFGCRDTAPPGSDAGSGAPSFGGFSDDDLRKPENCQACHAGQFAEWAGSMHAYAAEDPIFLAMNRRGQEETNGRLGDFCVGCHAPLAVRDGLTTDGSNLEELPPEYRGVNCYFCHLTDEVEGTHNNQLRLARDGVMRGPFDDPVENEAHASAYSPLLDSTHEGSSAACGACHDVTLPETLVGREIPLERTFEEWKSTLFARAHAEGGLGCASCHMPISPERTRSADTTDAKERASRRHDFEAIDLALTPFPNRERQRVLVERLLDTSLLAEMCVSRIGVIEVTLENAGSGHGWPSGATQDREVWLEVKAFDATGQELYANAEPGLPHANDAGAVNPLDLVLLKDFVLDDAGEPAHMFWDVREVADSTVLPGVATRDPLDPAFHRERRSWLFNTQQAGTSAIDRVTLRVRFRAVALEVLADLVASGHLARQFLDTMPVLDVLPDRCHDPELRETYQALIGAGAADCAEETAEASDRAFTLVWRRENAVPGHRTYRAARVADLPADCLSHPTYVPAPN